MSENTQQVAKITNAIATDVLNSVNKRMELGSLQLPTDYSAANALQEAYLMLSEDKNKPLDKCSVGSVTKALFNMATKGLNPAKNQCYFVPYGNELKLSVSYIGNIALAKRLGGVKNIKGQVIYKNDDFKFQINPKSGRKEIISHSQSLESLEGGEIVGAYAIAEFNDGTFDVEIMTMPQIKKAWEQGAMKGNSPAHKNFPDQMAIKSVINRLTKIINGSSDDSYLNDDNESNKVKADVKSEIKQNANSQPLDFEEAQVVEENNIVDVSSGSEETQAEIFPDEAPFKD
ncbi:recombination protein RecT [Chishuiella changwenlii]|uniref:Recombination protein RecT n=1 Tax=Chishuiella changwenlii TaxID=1434701 RepID=A0A1M6XBU8_9FLAO|nr:RecT family recombinase [Chishuiella changwenlii]GGF00367.1 DNA recombination protein RecT [Chishuiella changwenlii]SHL03403.1 recombination protein RecT [Chishuiella changwenlii]